jgi:hypothetical protein
LRGWIPGELASAKPTTKGDCFREADLVQGSERGTLTLAIS